MGHGLDVTVDMLEACNPIIGWLPSSPVASGAAAPLGCSRHTGLPIRRRASPSTPGSGTGTCVLAHTQLTGLVDVEMREGLTAQEMRDRTYLISLVVPVRVVCLAKERASASKRSHHSSVGCETFSPGPPSFVSQDRVHRRGSPHVCGCGWVDAP